MMELSENCDRHPQTLSQGQRQRLGGGFEAFIEPHRLAWACNDVRKGGRDIPMLLTVGELERYVG